MRLVAAAAAAVSLGLLAGPALAGPVVAGFDTYSLARNDDAASGAVSLGFSANFFGTTYGQAYVSNNGYITFNGGQSTYTPSGLGTGYGGQPIIAAFFADVDTRGANSALTSWGTGTYAGHDAFGVTWDGVGYYPSSTNKLNYFQLLLVDRSDTGAGNFDIYFNYDQIQWETGNASGGSNGLGGTSASVGYNAGQAGNPAGTYYELDGSLVPGSFLDGGPYSLAAGSNNGVPGQYLFEVRNGTVTQPQLPVGVPEPASLALFGAGLLGLAVFRRRAARD